MRGPLLVEARVQVFGHFEQVGLARLAIQEEQNLHARHVAVPAHRVRRGLVMTHQRVEVAAVARDLVLGQHCAEEDRVRPAVLVS